MKKDAEAKKLPPIYRGKWATASKEEVEAMKATGAPFCYRFKVPKVNRGEGRRGRRHEGYRYKIPKMLPWIWGGKGRGRKGGSQRSPTKSHHKLPSPTKQVFVFAG